MGLGCEVLLGLGLDELDHALVRPTQLAVHGVVVVRVEPFGVGVEDARGWASPGRAVPFACSWAEQIVARVDKPRWRRVGRIPPVAALACAGLDIVALYSIAV